MKIYPAKPTLNLRWSLREKRKKTMENYISMRSLFDENLVKLKGKQKKKMTERHSVEVKKLTNVISNEM